MTIENLNSDYEELENYLKILKSKNQNNNDINVLLNVLNCPVFKNIVNVQNSLKTLSKECKKYPNLNVDNFDITSDGDLKLIDLPIESINSNYVDDNNISINEDEDRFWHYVKKAAKGRDVIRINLFKSENECLGFNVVGLKDGLQDNLGIFVENIVKDGIADRNGNLQEGDQILAINNEMLDCDISHDKAISILQNVRGHIQLIVAKSENDVDNKFFKNLSKTQVEDLSNIVPMEIAENENCQLNINQESELDPNYALKSNISLESYSNLDQSNLNKGILKSLMQVENYLANETEENSENKVNREFENLDYNQDRISVINQSDDIDDIEDKEIKTIEIKLKKDKKGLGITIAGYVCEKEDISGIFVKSIAPNSAADLCGEIQLNDQIIQVDGISLIKFTNHQAVEVLRNTGQIVELKLARYLKGNKYDRLQLAINNADFNLAKPPLPIKPVLDNQTILHIKQENKTFDEIDNNLYKSEAELKLLNLNNIKEYWYKKLDNKQDIIIASFTKFDENSGLGISLEGTLEQEEGKEPKPRHYIESILKQGPVGLNGILKPGDQILQVNDSKVYDMDHNEVVKSLRELPLHVIMVCARAKDFDENNILEKTHEEDENIDNNFNLYENFMLNNCLNQGERLVKAKSDGSLAIVNSNLELLKLKSRSLEPLTTLAMWSSEPQLIELMKGERGLGFSILDYQDPMNPNETVIVIRSLVQGGVAQQNGSLLPGDRLLAVNDISLENASLDLAVQALKGAPKGLVKILVAKPLPITENSTNQLNSFSFANFSNTLNLNDSVLRKDNEENNEQQINHTVWKSFEDIDKIDFLMNENLEKSYITKDDSILINRYRSYSPMSLQYESNESMNFCGYTEIPIPIELERPIVIEKKNQNLGVTLELSDQGINGLIIKSLHKKGVFKKDGRLKIGDNLLSINHESLRNTTTSKAKAILKRVNLVEGSIPLKYVPENEAVCYRKNLSFEKSKSRFSLPSFKNYCRTPSPVQRSLLNFDHLNNF